MSLLWINRELKFRVYNHGDPLASLPDKEKVNLWMNGEFRMASLSKVSMGG